MCMKKQHVTLRAVDKTDLEKLIGQGELPVKVHRRAIILLELDRGKSYEAVSKTLGLHPNTVSRIASRYQNERLASLYDRARSGRPVEIDGHQRAKITALACSDPPEGYSTWSLRMLADKVVELGYCEQIAHTTVQEILKKTR